MFYTKLKDALSFLRQSLGLSEGLLDTFRFNESDRILIETSFDGIWTPCFDGEIIGVKLHRRKKGSSGQTVVDIKINEVSIYSNPDNRPKIPASAGDDVLVSGGEIGLGSFTDVSKITADIVEIENGGPKDLTLVLTVKYTV